MLSVQDGRLRSSHGDRGWCLGCGMWPSWAELSLIKR